MCATDLWAHIRFMLPILSLKLGVTTEKQKYHKYTYEQKYRILIIEDVNK